MLSPLNISVILLAGGLGQRMNSPVPKQLIPLAGKPIVLHSFDLFISYPGIHEIIVVCDPQYRAIFPSIPQLKFALPGVRRQDSFKNGLDVLSDLTDLVCIHDAARPLLKREDLQHVIAEAANCGAAALGVPLKPTIKQIDAEGFVLNTPKRASLWEVQTPQVIQKNLLLAAVERVEHDHVEVTDELSMVELLNKPAKLVMGSYSNLKITTPEDLIIASVHLSS